MPAEPYLTGDILVLDGVHLLASMHPTSAIYQPLTPKICHLTTLNHASYITLSLTTVTARCELGLKLMQSCNCDQWGSSTAVILTSR
jgi:hypothetical protein